MHKHKRIKPAVHFYNYVYVNIRHAKTKTEIKTKVVKTETN